MESKRSPNCPSVNREINLPIYYMPNTKILADIQGESVDTPKKFTNIDNESFEFTWDSKLLGGVLGNKTKIEAGETVIMPKYMVNYAAMHLARKIHKRECWKGLSEAERMQGPIRFVNAEEEMKLQEQMIVENFPKVVPAEDESKAEPPKTEFKCQNCEFIAKSAFGLQVHQRKHNKEG